jgi:hypothetical protein
MEVVWVAMRDSVAALRFGEDDVTADEQPIAEGLGTLSHWLCQTKSYREAPRLLGALRICSDVILHMTQFSTLATVLSYYSFKFLYISLNEKYFDEGIYCSRLALFVFLLYFAADLLPHVSITVWHLKRPN